MATYFHGGNQEMDQTSDGLHTLYLMNPNYNHNNNSHHHHNHHHQQVAAAATAATTHQNMILLNSSLPHALSHPHVSHAPPPPLSQSHFLTIPFAQPISADDTARSGNSFHYNLWGGNSGGGAGGGGGGGQIEVSMSGGMGVTGTHPYQIQLDNSDMLFRRPAVVSPTTNQQGLSLSLSSQPHLASSNNNNNNNNNRSVSISVGGGGGGSGGSSSSAPQVAVSAVLDGSLNGVHNFIMGSKYLKAAQELLDEVVSVGKGAAEAVSTAVNDTVKKEKEKVVHMDNGDDNINGESEAEGRSSRAAPPELTVTQRQELQMKKTKLINMLNEVEQTYRQYNHQMKTVVSSFEQVAGFGSAKCYTSLALKTISKQFRCLKDAITSQVKEISKSLGEEVGEDCLGVKGDGSTRLRMIDHQLRQQRALQQLGMIQHNAWRPQRGLPERAVSVLRAWLFEHFLHPYPKDSDKHMLAKQTGLTRNQVSNWFINARVRLWKPMVEEMYLEEVKDQQEQKGSNQDSNNNTTNNNNNGVTIAKSPDTNLKQQLGTNGQQLQQQQQQQQNASPNDISNSTISTSPNASSFHAPPPPPGFTLIGTSSSDMDGLLQYKKPRGETQNSPSSILSAGEINFSRQVDHQSSNLTTKFGPYGTCHDNNNNGGGFGTYHQLGELGRFNPNHQLAQNFHHSNNGSVSLTLGLPPGENLAQNYFSGQNMHVYDRGLQMAGNAAEGGDFCGVINNNNNNPQAGSSPHSNMGFQNMEIQNRKGYAAQLLPDFVA